MPASVKSTDVFDVDHWQTRLIERINQASAINPKACKVCRRFPASGWFLPAVCSAFRLSPATVEGRGAFRARPEDGIAFSVEGCDKVLT